MSLTVQMPRANRFDLHCCHCHVATTPLTEWKTREPSLIESKPQADRRGGGARVQWRKLRGIDLPDGAHGGAGHPIEGLTRHEGRRRTLIAMCPVSVELVVTQVDGVDADPEKDESVVKAKAKAIKWSTADRGKPPRNLMPKWMIIGEVLPLLEPKMERTHQLLRLLLSQVQMISI